MREVPVTAQGAIALGLLDDLTSQLRSRRTLADVLDWCRAQVPPLTVTEILTQDEYTHDVIIAHAERAYLVFDTT